MGILLCPSHNGFFNNEGAAYLGDLQDQMVPFTDFKRHVVEQPASSEGEIDECPFTLRLFFDSCRTDKAFEGKQCTSWSEMPRMLAAFNDLSML